MRFSDPMSELAFAFSLYGCKVTLWADVCVTKTSGSMSPHSCNKSGCLRSVQRTCDPGSVGTILALWHGKLAEQDDTALFNSQPAPVLGNVLACANEQKRHPSCADQELVLSLSYPAVGKSWLVETWRLVKPTPHVPVGAFLRLEVCLSHASEQCEVGSAFCLFGFSLMFSPCCQFTF